MSLFHQPEEIIQGKYCITGVLGKGGVAVTYSAIALATNSPVAIKVISLKQLDNWKQVELFQREADILKQLNHPNIPDYIDYFDIETRSDKAFYLVQQLAPGKSLYQLVESGWHITEKEVKDIAQKVLSILSYLHSLDPPVIHRDIKPHNLIRSDEGKIYLVDFGAVQNTYYNTLMQGSTVVGTYGYMAPEQFRGQALPATDLYSLGATLLYLLTHRSPAELPQDTLKLDFRSAVDISESFVEWLENILEPDAEDRFDSADLASTKLFAVERKKHKMLLTNISISILLLGLIIGANSYKWFFLSRLGFFPSKLCYSHIMDDFIEQKGNINYIARQQRTSVFSCIVKAGDKQRIKQAINNFDRAK
ncbi:MAG: serine/threonine-protein kinase, partial [Cyanobacteria bacterium J06635_13]